MEPTSPPPARAERARAPMVSVVTPVYNEQESVRPLYAKLRDVMDAHGGPHELVFVDDGSSDDTYPILKELRDRDPRIRVVRFRRNFGQTAAMMAGFQAARGEFVVSMDGDLQNDPQDIPRLLKKLYEGFDVVCGWRKNRQDKFLTRRVPSVVANWLIGRITGVRIHDNGCSLKAYRASVIKSVSLYGEMHRFIPAMSTLAGARITEIVVNHHPRKFGESKYGLNRVWKVALDIVSIKMITSFAARPALWFGLCSLPTLLAGAAALAAAAVLFSRGSTEEWLISCTVGVTLFYLGAHLLSFGVIGELALRTGDYAPNRVLLPTIERAKVRDGQGE